MPRNQIQRMIFAFITVVFTVHAYVFYSLYIVNADAIMAATGAASVGAALKAQGGVYMFGAMLPVWAVIAVEFCFAYVLECLMGSPCSFLLARRVFDPQKNHPMLFETAIICATVGLMCPAMSLIAAFLYFPYYSGFTVGALLVSWARLVCVNLPFAYFSQLFFIQPLVRSIFKLLFRRDIKAQAVLQASQKPRDEVEAIESLLERVDTIKQELEAEKLKTNV